MGWFNRGGEGRDDRGDVALQERLIAEGVRDDAYSGARTAPLDDEGAINRYYTAERWAVRARAAEAWGNDD